MILSLKICNAPINVKMGGPIPMCCQENSYTSALQFIKNIYK